MIDFSVDLEGNTVCWKTHDDYKSLQLYYGYVHTCSDVRPHIGGVILWEWWWDQNVDVPTHKLISDLVPKHLCCTAWRKDRAVVFVPHFCFWKKCWYIKKPHTCAKEASLCVSNIGSSICMLFVRYLLMQNCASSEFWIVFQEGATDATWNAFETICREVSRLVDTNHSMFKTLHARFVHTHPVKFQVMNTPGVAQDHLQ